MTRLTQSCYVSQQYGVTNIEAGDQLRLVWPDYHFKVICNKHRREWLTYISEAGSSLSHYLSWMLYGKKRSKLVRPNHHYPIICLYYWCDVEVINQLTLVWPDRHINTIMLWVRTLGACDQIITIMVSFTTVVRANIRKSDQLSLVWPKNHHFLVSVKTVWYAKHWSKWPT